jgi:hypothetical protein
MNVLFFFSLQFVITAIFRDIYVWPVDFSSVSYTAASIMTGYGNELPLATIRAPIGIVSDLFITSGREASAGNQLISVVGCESPRVDIWNVGVAMAMSKTAAAAASRDRLTSPIRDVIVTENDSHAFVLTAGGDEIGAYDMTSGQMVDLMTHEGEVAAYCVSPNGRYMMVSLEKAKPGQFNKVSHGCECSASLKQSHLFKCLNPCAY